MNLAHMNPEPFGRPYVISWNLTYRCNLACEHCYLDAGGTPQVGTENFADRSELNTEECFKVIDEIAAFAQNEGLDLVVMGSHGYGRIKSAVMGSTR